MAAGAVAEAVVDPGSNKADMAESGGEDGASREDVTVDMVRQELQRMVENVERSSGISDTMGELRSDSDAGSGDRGCSGNGQ